MFQLVGEFELELVFHIELFMLKTQENPFSNL